MPRERGSDTEVNDVMPVPEPPAGTFPGSPHLSDLEAEDGTRWLDYRKTLTPRFGIVWRDIALCHVMLWTALATVAITQFRFGLSVGASVAVPTTIWIGYWLKALASFGHEAVHNNIAPERARNDRLADWLVWIYFAQTTRAYRDVHWAHHWHLGDHDDTEISYHNCLSPWFMVRSFTGLNLLEVLLRYHRYRNQESPGDQASGEPARLATLRSMVVHGLLVGMCLWLGLPVVAGCWVISVLLVFPGLVSLQQVLEHRRLDEGCSTDFKSELHGPVNRMFGTDIISRYFGAAGFNRHMLHHWDPGVSYTRFDDMEAFVRRTGERDTLVSCTTSYARAFQGMLRSTMRA